MELIRVGHSAVNLETSNEAWSSGHFCGAGILPITPVSGRVNPADFGAVESGSYKHRFHRVFGTLLKRTAGRADPDAQLLGDDPP
jgi:hypothetical protein